MKVRKVVTKKQKKHRREKWWKVVLIKAIIALPQLTRNRINCWFNFWDGQKWYMKLQKHWKKLWNIECFCLHCPKPRLGLNIGFVPCFSLWVSWKKTMLLRKLCPLSKLSDSFSSKRRRKKRKNCSSLQYFHPQQYVY